MFTRTGAADRHETWFVSGADHSDGEAYGTSIVTDGKRVIGGAPYVDVSSLSFLQDQGRVYSSTPDLVVATTPPTASVTSGPPTVGP